MIDLLKKKENINKRLIVLIDGEHYPDVTLDAIKLIKKKFPGKFAGIVFLGGTEKLVLDDPEHYFGEKVFLVENFSRDIIKALHVFNPDIAYDLSDEPVVNYRKRMLIASYCLANNCSYMGPDFCFMSFPRNIKVGRPSISIIGTGKRIGKTAVSSYIANFYVNNNVDICIVAMGRGGPKTPQVLKGYEIELTPEYLLDLSHKGFHASSDYIEDALMSRVNTVGCRRCGGGFGGKIFLTNVKEGIKEAEKLNPNLVIIEGSGASVPDVETDANICVIGAFQQWESIIGYLGIYRIMSADLIILTMCEHPLADERKILFLEREISKINPGAKIIRSIFRPKPLSNIKGKKVFVVMTAKHKIENEIREYLEKNYKCKVAFISFNLSNRKLLRQDLELVEDYDTILTELKAASVDVLTEFSFKNNKDIIYMNNIPVIISDNTIFEKELKNIYKKIKNSGV